MTSRGPVSMDTVILRVFGFMQADALTAQFPSHLAGGTRHMAAELGGQLGFLEHEFSTHFLLNLVF